MPLEETKLPYQTSVLSRSANAASSCSIVIFFDGVCGLCHGFIRFIVRRDPAHLIRFAPLQGKTFALLLARAPWLAENDSLIVVIRVANREAIYVRSRAVFMVLSELSAPWKWGTALRIIPAPLMDLGYRIVSKLRYRLFGKKESCHFSTPETKPWILD